MSAPLLAATGLRKYFRSRAHPFARERAARAVDGVDLSVARGETLAVVGESGCGKSTLARLLLRLIEPDAGELVFDGHDIARLPARRLRPLRAGMQMIFQDPFASLNPRYRARDVVGEPLRVHGLPGARARVEELLAIVGLGAEHADRFPHEFSGGQRQRIGIARALASKPQLIVADEAVSALDVSIQAQVLNLLQSLKRRFGLTLVFISHDLGAVRHVSDRVAVMYLGQIVELAPTDALFDQPLHPYARALLDAIPSRHPAARGQKRAIAPGDAPSPVNPPPGCRFHTRCPHAAEMCRAQMPLLREVDAGRKVACHFAEAIAAAAPPAAAPVLDSAARIRRTMIYMAAQAERSRQSRGTLE